MKHNIFHKNVIRGIAALLCTILVSSCAYENGPYSSNYPNSNRRTSGSSVAPLLIGAAAIGAIALASKKKKKHYNHHYNHPYCNHCRSHCGRTCAHYRRPVYNHGYNHHYNRPHCGHCNSRCGNTCAHYRHRNHHYNHPVRHVSPRPVIRHHNNHHNHGHNNHNTRPRVIKTITPAGAT